MYNTDVEVDGRRAYCDLQIKLKIMFLNSRNNMQWENCGRQFLFLLL